jgi:hypothetical protein
LIVVHCILCGFLKGTISQLTDRNLLSTCTNRRCGKKSPVVAAAGRAVWPPVWPRARLATLSQHAHSHHANTRHATRRDDDSGDASHPTDASGVNCSRRPLDRDGSSGGRAFGNGSISCPRSVRAAQVIFAPHPRNALWLDDLGTALWTRCLGSLRNNPNILPRMRNDAAAPLSTGWKALR